MRGEQRPIHDDIGARRCRRKERGLRHTASGTRIAARAARCARLAAQWRSASCGALGGGFKLWLAARPHPAGCVLAGSGRSPAPRRRSGAAGVIRSPAVRCCRTTRRSDAAETTEGRKGGHRREGREGGRAWCEESSAPVLGEQRPIHDDSGVARLCRSS